MENKKIDKRKFNGGHSTKGKAGRRRKDEELLEIELIDAVISPEKWKDIISAIAEKALGGDVKAFDSLMNRRYGKVKEYIDVTTGEEKINMPTTILKVKKIKPE